jgi:N-acetyl-anhydromuramyl-L-alanine amidase AmpD/prophage tail gpP-like protein
MISNIESFYIDSSLDNDADSWQVEIGDSTGEFLAMLERNHEVRIELISSVPGGAGHLFTGISDEISYDQSGLLSVTGRDYSSLALDSICPPVRYKHVKAGYVVANQARKLGFTNISLAKTGQVKKTIKTDGSETFWEFWYRLYRNEKMWLWVGPNGALIGNRLNYDQHISYYFGTPQQTDTRLVQSMHVPVESIEIRKSTQGRIGSVWVMVKDGKKTFWVKTGLSDPTMDGWLKRPFRIIQDTVSHNEFGGRAKGWDEIFEGKVGSLEIRVTVSDPTHIFQTNKIARLRIPEIGYGGEFFVVGWRMQADSTGVVQEIRLREKLIALSRRIPHEPIISPPKSFPKDGTTSSLTEQEINDILAALIPNDHGAWADFFYKAAQQFHGIWDADLFLACLLGISWIDTRIRNVRETTGHHDNVEWTAPPPEPIGPPDLRPQYGPLVGPPAALDTYHETFANEIETVRSLEIGHKELGVGPMQLIDRDLKREADDRMGSGGIATSSITSKKIDSYLKAKSSPLSGFGDEHVSSGKKHNVDPRMIVAISGAETSFATDPNAGSAITTGHNAWGMLDANSNSIPYASWPEGIEAVAANLGGPTYIGGGLKSVAEIQIHWAPSGAANDPDGLNNNWTRNVTKFLQDLGGTPNDVTYKNTPDSAPATSASHDQYIGGRWDPESNIWIGGEAFAAALKATGRDPTDGDQKSAMWEAGARYDGTFGNATGEIFSNKLRRAVMISPGFLKTVQDVISSLRANSNSGSNTSGTTGSRLLPVNWPSEHECLTAFQSGSWIGDVAPTDPSPIAPLPQIKFLQAHYYTEGRILPIKWIVIHTMGNDKTSDAAQNVANMFAAGGNAEGPASAHYCIDNEHIIQCVHDKDEAYSVKGSDSSGNSINMQSLNFEHAGGNQSASEWQDTFSQQMLRLSAKLTAQRAHAWGIPMVHVIPSGLAAGQSGFAGHVDFSTAFPVAGGHADPGPDFPWAQYMQMVSDEAANL